MKRRQSGPDPPLLELVERERRAALGAHEQYAATPVMRYRPFSVGFVVDPSAALLAIDLDRPDVAGDAVERERRVRQIVRPRREPHLNLEDAFRVERQLLPAGLNLSEHRPRRP